MDAFTLTSITGYKDHDFFYTEDYDGTPLNINNCLLYTSDAADDDYTV